MFIAVTTASSITAFSLYLICPSVLPKVSPAYIRLTGARPPMMVSTTKALFGGHPATCRSDRVSFGIHLPTVMMFSIAASAGGTASPVGTVIQDQIHLVIQNKDFQC